MSALAVPFAGLALDSPLVLASGVLGTTASSLRRVAEAGAGAVTTKSCSLAPRKGHPAPCIPPWKGGMLNAGCLSNPGAAGAAVVGLVGIAGTPWGECVKAVSGVIPFGPGSRRN